MNIPRLSMFWDPWITKLAAPLTPRVSPAIRTAIVSSESVSAFISS